MGALLTVVAYGAGSVACASVLWFFARGMGDLWQSGDKRAAVALGLALAGLILLALFLLL